MLVQKAIHFAVEAHKEQKRKATHIPYIFHPVETGYILADNGFDDEIIAAGILHDILEDTHYTQEDLLKEFGLRITNLVIGASEENRKVPGVTWKERKQKTIQFLQTEASEQAQAVACADKLSNMRSIIKDYARYKEKLWGYFNAGYEDQKWYYQSLAESLKSLEGYPMYEEFCEKVKEMFE